jgi:mannose-6-phosphate isomerase
MNKVNFDQPFFFKPNRVWRLYTGGLLLDYFRGKKPEGDGRFPEEWLASTVRACNGEHAQTENEGLAEVICENGNTVFFLNILNDFGKEILGEKHFKKYGPNIGVLCKYLDSAVRLPIQCHPDKGIAQKLYHSSYGKTECWHIISTRNIKNEKPYILLGFKKNICSEVFKKAVIEQNIEKMINMLHKIPVKPGETYFVPARMPHAIGPGVFMVEVQEPSDWVIQPEQFCAGIKLTNNDMWGPLTPEEGLNVFDYRGFTKSELFSKVLPSNKILIENKDIKIQELIGETHTDSFSLWRIQVKNESEIQIGNKCSIIIIKDGKGRLKWDKDERFLNRSDYFFKPYNLKKFIIKPEDFMEILVCLPPNA